jgi:aryl-alcohol dehydrogenase-like predicted oxidoreductase
MKIRPLGNQGIEATEVGLGCWQLGGGWGVPWSDAIAQDTLHAAYDSGVRFFDTADVYGDGESERSLGAFRKSHPDVFIATKLGRAGGLFPNNHTEEGLRAATLRSMERLGVERIDLTQLHCVPEGVLRDGRIFDWLRRQQDEGLISTFGASVESVEEGLLCLEQEGLASLQVIFNIFRQKPAEELLPAAKEKGVGIIVRLPLASGLLTGKLDKTTVFSAQDHRSFNREGQSFNVGETFAGIRFEKGVELSERMAAFVPPGMTMAQMALRWILDHDAVSVVIPGASSPQQAQANVSASELAPLPKSLHDDLRAFYEQEVQHEIRGPY